MANETLGLKIVANLNAGLSIAQLNKDISALAKHPSLKKLKINISIDENFVKNLSSFSKNLNIITQQLNQQSTANNKLNNGLNNTTETIKNQTKVTNEAIAAEKKWQTEREKTNSKGITTTTYGNKQNNDKQVVTTLADGSIKNIDNIKNQIRDFKAIEALDRDHFNAIKTNKKMIEDIEKVHYLALQKNRDLDWKNLQAVNKQAEALDKAHYQALKANNDMIIKSRQQTQSLANSAYSSKQSVNSTSSGINDAKAVELLNRQYDKVLANLNAVKASGAQLTEKELAGINRRIQALDALAARQKKSETDQAQLLSTQLRAEQKVLNLTNNKNLSTADTAKLNTLLTQLKALDTTVSNFKGKAAQLVSDINKIGASAQNAGGHTNTFGKSLKGAMSNMLMYAGMGSIFFGVINAFKEMTNTIIQVDTQMTMLKRVMNEDTDFEGMLRRNIELADQFSTSLISVNDAAIEFGRMGFGDAQIASLTKAAVLFQTVGEVNAKESVDAIVAGMVNFNIAASDSISIVDQLNNVDNRFSTTSKDLALVLTKSGSAAYTFGRSLQGLVGDATAVSEATRESGTVTGNFLKSLYSRLSTMEKSEPLLAQAGVAMRDLNGEVKDADQLIPELAANWAGLTEETQRNVSVGLAGRNHLNRFAALMSNFSTSISASEVALHSQGSAMRESEKRAGSLEARITKMKVAWQTLAVGMGDTVISDVIKLVTLLMGSLGKGFTTLAEKFGGLPVLFATLSTALFLTSGRFRTMATSMTMAIGRLVGIVPASTAATAGLRGMALAAKITEVSIKGLLSSTVVGVALVGIGYGLEWLIGKFSDTTDEVDDLTTSLEDLEQKSVDLSSLKSLSSQYEELTSKTKLTTEEKIKLSNIESELKENHGIILQSIEGQTGATELNTEAIKKRTAALQEEIKTMRESAILDYQTQQTDINKDIEEQGEKLKELSDIYEEAQRQKDTFELNRSKGKYSDQYTDKELNTSAEDLANSLKEAKKAFEEADVELQREINKKAVALKASFAIYIGGLKDSGAEVSSQATQFADAYATIMSKTPQNSDAIFGDFQKAFEVFKTSNVQNVEEAISLFEKLPGITDLNGDALKDLQDILSQYNLTPVFEDTEGAALGTEDAILSLKDAVSLLGNGVSNSAAEMDEFYKSVSNGKSEIELLNTAQKELKKSGSLSTSTMSKLSESFVDFSSNVGGSNESLLQYLETQEKDRIETIKSQKDKTQSLIDNSYIRIGAMQAEMSAIVKLQEAYAVLVNNGELSDLEAERRLGTRRKMSSDQTILEEKRKINALQDQLKVLGFVEQDYKAAAEATDESTKSNNDNYDSVSDTVEILTDLQKALLDVEVAQKKLQNSQDKLKDGSKERQASISKEISLLKEQKRLYEEGIKDPSKLVSTKVTTTVKTKSGDDSTSSSTGSSSSSSNPSISEMLSTARKLQGDFKYEQVAGEYKGTFDEFVKDATSDCSQFVQEMFKEFLNVKVPRTAAEQAKQGVAVSKADLKEGDLVFFNTTGKANSHVGIYSGNGKFVGMGNSGLKESSLNSSYWSDKYQGARRIASGSSSSASSSDGKTTSKVGGTTVKTDGATAKESEAAKLNAQDKIVAIDSQIYATMIKSLDNTKTGFQQLIADQERQIEASKRKQNTLDPNSAAWRHENNSQINSQSRIQSLKHDEKNQLHYMMDTMRIESADYDEYLKQLSSDWLDIRADKNTKAFENITSSIDASKQRIADLGNLIDISKNKIAQFEEGSPEYNKELNYQIELTKKQKTVNDELIASTEKQLTNQKLDAKEKSDLNKILDEAKLEDYTAKIKNLNAELIGSKRSTLAKVLTDLDSGLELSKAKTDLMTEGTSGYNAEIKNQISIIKEQIAANQQLITFTETQIKNEELLADKRAEYKEELNGLILANYSYNKSIKEINQSLIEFSNNTLSTLIDTMKSSIGKSDLFNLSEFNDSIDSIISSLDQADKQYLTNVSFVDTSTSARSSLSDYASKVKDIAFQVKSALSYYQNMDTASFGNLSSLSSQINSQVRLVASLKTKLEEINNTVRDTELQYSKEEAALAELITTREKYYDSQIEAQQTVLKNLDDQLEKEDRLKALQDINDELNKVRNDKRFEYVTESGELILTFDKARVEELEKQKDDLVKQYEREDVKTAIQGEIDRLQKAKDSEVDILNKNLEKTKAIHQADLESLKLYQSSLSSLYDQTVSDTQTKLDQFQAAIQQGLLDGTITTHEATTLLESVVNTWQSLSLNNWDTYITNVTDKLTKLKQLYAEMANAANEALLAPQIQAQTQTDSGRTPLDPKVAADTQAAIDAAIRTPKMIEYEEAAKKNKDMHWDGSNWVYNTPPPMQYTTGTIVPTPVEPVRRYHTGGTAGQEPLKANEIPAILKLGEDILTEAHKEYLKNMFLKSRPINTIGTNLQNPMAKYNLSTINNQKTSEVNNHYSYNFGDIKANDPMELLNGIEHLITSQRR